MMTEAQQDALFWLEDEVEVTVGGSHAQTVLDMIEDAESRENTVIGMCLARRPHDEIRDYLIGDQS